MVGDLIMLGIEGMVIYNYSEMLMLIVSFGFFDVEFVDNIVDGFEF